MMPTNQQIAQRLRYQANQLARTGENLYRVRAYRQAALTVLALPEELATLLATNQQALEQLPGIGKRLAKTLASYLTNSSTGARA
jgi:DNA polymerase (family 10)